MSDTKKPSEPLVETMETVPVYKKLLIKLNKLSIKKVTVIAPNKIGNQNVESGQQLKIFTHLLQSSSNGWVLSVKIVHNLFFCTQSIVFSTSYCIRYLYNFSNTATEFSASDFTPFKK